LYRYFVSQSSEFCRHNPLCCFPTSVCCRFYCLFRYRLSPETSGYTLVSLSTLCSPKPSFYVPPLKVRDQVSHPYSTTGKITIDNADTLQNSKKMNFPSTPTEQSPSSEPNSLSASQEMTWILWNPKVHYHIHKGCHMSLSLAA